MSDEVKIEQFKPNSNKSKTHHKKEIKSVVQGKTKPKEDGVGQKLAKTMDVTVEKNAFFSKAGEILIPAIKSMIGDLVTGLIDELLYGGQRRSSVSSRLPHSRVNYSQYSRQRMNTRTIRSGPKEGISRRSSDYRELVYDTREDASNVLDGMLEIIEEYDVASIADLNELSGIESNYTDSGYGWDDLRDARIKRYKNGFILELPLPYLID